LPDNDNAIVDGVRCDLTGKHRGCTDRPDGPARAIESDRQRMINVGGNRSLAQYHTVRSIVGSLPSAEELGVGYVVEGSVRKAVISCGSWRSSTTSQPAATSGRSVTIATLPTFSLFGTRSPNLSSRRLSRSCTLPKIFAPHYVLTLASLALTIWGFVEIGCLRGTAGPDKCGSIPLNR
jgi:hypothetical protein